MRGTITILVAAFCVATVTSYPLRQGEQLQSEALNRLMMAEADNETALRSKRTIGILRQLFPGISQMIEQKVNSITAQVIRVLGPVVLRSLLGGGMNNGGMNRIGGGEGGTASLAGAGGATATASSPFDDDDDDEGRSLSAMSSSGSRVSISLPTYPPDEERETTLVSTTNPAPTTASNPSSTGSVPTTTLLETTATNFISNIINSGPTTGANTSDVNPEAEDRANEVAAESQNNEVRVQFADEQTNEASPPELTPLDEIETNDDENRNKRFLNFGFGGSGGAGSGGSGAGSGNFIFDIIRQAADGAARAAGTVYRVVAGTQSLGLGLSASRDVGPAPQMAAPGAAPGAPSAPSSSAAPASAAGNQPPLVAGSASQPSNASGTATAGRTDGTQEAVPGPVTRLFVIANRGISNLIQDLILRLAATSERIVNFKARLITSII